MFLHLGGDISVRLDDVVSIHPVKLFSDPKNKRYLEDRKDMTVDVSEGDPASVVILEKRIYLSKLSSGTLKARSSVENLLGRRFTI